MTTDSAQAVTAENGMSSQSGPDAYPLSPMQQGMLFHSIAMPDSDVYVEQLSSTLRGELREAEFQSAWKIMIDRHGTLRTAFAWQGLPQPLQVVGGKAGLPFEIVDWRHLSDGIQMQKLGNLRDLDRRKGVDLSRAPLMRLTLIHLSDEVHELVWTWHHIILDAWSVPILLEELFLIYASLLEGRKPLLPPCRPFKEFIAWQQSQNSSEVESFWRRELDGLTAPTPLGIDLGIDSMTQRARVQGNAKEGSDYALEFLAVSKAEVDALQSAARAAKLTVNTFVQGAWALLLGCYSGREEVLFGTAVSGRPPELDGVESMVGLLINTLPFRIQIPKQRQLRQWLKDIQQIQSDTRLYEHAALVDIQGWSSLPRGIQLFDSLLVFQNFPLDLDRLSGGGLQFEKFDFVERANFPLTVMLEIQEQGQLAVGYDTGRFDQGTMRRLLQHFRTILKDMVSNVDKNLADLELLTSDERKSLINTWSAGLLPILDRNALSEPVTRVFESQVGFAPDALSAVFAAYDQDISLSYHDLNTQANQMARQLHELGIKTGDRVAICMEASLTQLVAILGVMKAGACYVPLEPSHPELRLQETIEDCGASLVLVHLNLLETMSGLVTARVLALEDNLAQSTSDFAVDIKNQPGDNLATGPGLDDLAYIIYTSGSTGKPKGVAISHGSLIHLVKAQLLAFEIDETSRVLQFASLSFDASVSEIFTALAAGARLYMAPRKVLTPSREMLNLMLRWEVTTVTFPPSVLSQLPEFNLPKLQTLVSAGEACSLDLVQRWAPNCRFVNAYGPTETTVCATFGVLTASSGRSLIGRAVGDARVYVLDPQLRPVPIGVVGELFVGGPGVAWGYWNKPGLTAERFVPDPFSGIPGSRIYQTGDQVRFLSDGEIEFLGRCDDQVKIRGFRIEPGEIEATLKQDPAIRDAAVIAAGEDEENRHLVAYIVPDDSESDVEWWPSIAEYFVYDELAYFAMTNDTLRNDQYKAAIESVRDRVVLEVGTGPEALLSRFCAAAGARKVYAIEMLKDTYDKACAKVKECGLEDRIEVIHGDCNQGRAAGKSRFLRFRNCRSHRWM